MPDNSSSIILYQTVDGRTRIQCRFDDETIWLTQAQIAELFQTTPQNVTLHLKAIFAEGELSEAATCKDYLQVRKEGARSVSRDLRHYRLEVILAVGYRVRSLRGIQFRQWATARLSEYLVKGFTMDDERLKNPPGKGHTDYFEELLERVRDIRSSERRFYQKVLDIYATSVDYTPNSELSQRFFATVQNKMHWAAHGHTAAEVENGVGYVLILRQQNENGSVTIFNTIQHLECGGNDPNLTPTETFYFFAVASISIRVTSNVASCVLRPMASLQ